jgi:hypothetical protein
LPDENKEENSNSEIFLTPPQSLEEAQHRFIEFEEKYMH